MNERFQIYSRIGLGAAPGRKRLGFGYRVGTPFPTLGAANAFCRNLLSGTDPEKYGGLTGIRGGALEKYLGVAALKPLINIEIVLERMVAFELEDVIRSSCYPKSPVAHRLSLRADSCGFVFGTQRVRRSVAPPGVLA